MFLKKFFFIVFFTLSIPLISSAQQSVRAELNKLTNRLPTKAKIIRMLGNQWYEVEIKGQDFLYHYKGTQSSGYECITTLGTGKKFKVDPVDKRYIDRNIYGGLISSMPLNAKIVELLGRGWFVIEFEGGKRYLYHKLGATHGAESLCKLN